MGAYQNTVSKRIKPRAEISFPPIHPRDLILESLQAARCVAVLALQLLHVSQQAIAAN